MQAHTKKLPIETIELRFLGPIVNMAQAIENLKPLGFSEMNDDHLYRTPYFAAKIQLTRKTVFHILPQ